MVWVCLFLFKKCFFKLEYFFILRPGSNNATNLNGFLLIRLKHVYIR